MGQKNDPHYGEDADQQPHMGEREEPKGGGDKRTGARPSKETGTDTDETKPTTENM